MIMINIYENSVTPVKISQSDIISPKFFTLTLENV